MSNQAQALELREGRESNPSIPYQRTPGILLLPCCWRRSTSYPFAEVAAVLRVSRATVYKLCDTGRLQCVHFVNVIRVQASALRRFTDHLHQS